MSEANSVRSEISNPSSPPKGSPSQPEQEEDEVTSYVRSLTAETDPVVEEFRKDLKRQLAANRLDIAGMAARYQRQREEDQRVEQFGEVSRPADWLEQEYRELERKYGRLWRLPSPKRPHPDDK